MAKEYPSIVKFPRSNRCSNGLPVDAQSRKTKLTSCYMWPTDRIMKIHNRDATQISSTEKLWRTPTSSDEIDNPPSAILYLGGQHFEGGQVWWQLLELPPHIPHFVPIKILCSLLYQFPFSTSHECVHLEETCLEASLIVSAFYHAQNLKIEHSLSPPFVGQILGFCWPLNIAAIRIAATHHYHRSLELSIRWFKESTEF